MKKNSKILIFGAGGLLGGSISNLLRKKKYENLLTPSSKKLNLLNPTELEKYLKKKNPSFIFMTAGKVGGIVGNINNQADFLYENTLMILNLLEGIKKTRIKTKLLYTGSTCIYPNNLKRPIKEEDLLSDKLEKTNIGYAISKITGVIACQKYSQQYKLKTICAMPTNLYGIGDNYDIVNGHFLPNLIKKFVVAKEKNSRKITFWGSGKPKRESLYNEDCADALIYLMRNYNNSEEIINIGTGIDYSIKEYVDKMKKIVGYNGEIIWDKSKPDGTKKKQTDITKLKNIYPKFSSRSFEAGVKEILVHDIKRILREPQNTPFKTK